MSKLNELFTTSLHVVNFGIESFYDDLASQKVDAVHVDWKPIAGGDKAAAANLRGEPARVLQVAPQPGPDRLGPLEPQVEPQFKGAEPPTERDPPVLVLHDVGVGRRAEHLVGHREQQVAVLDEGVGRGSAHGHPSSVERPVSSVEPVETIASGSSQTSE